MNVVCPGCGLELESNDSSLDERNNASAACRQLYDEVQFAHMALAKTRRDWPRFAAPKGKAVLTVANVVRGLNEKNYRQRINEWGKVVWEWWRPEHERVAELINRYLRV